MSTYGRILYSIQVNTHDYVDRATHTPITYYRFRSLFNDCVGIYYDNENDAIAEGEAHADILRIIYPQLAILQPK